MLLQSFFRLCRFFLSTSYSSNHHHYRLHQHHHYSPDDHHVFLVRTVFIVKMSHQYLVPFSFIVTHIRISDFCFPSFNVFSFLSLISYLGLCRSTDCSLFFLGTHINRFTWSIFYLDMFFYLISTCIHDTNGDKHASCKNKHYPPSIRVYRLTSSVACLPIVLLLLLLLLFS